MINLEKENKITCPNCGKTFNIHNEYETPLTKAQKRLQALQARGIDTSLLFAMQTGGIGRLDNGVISVLDDSDPIFADIMNGGTISNHNLFRRWVMSQMFHMISNPNGFSETLRSKGYDYQFKMLERELKAQCKLDVDDKENFEIRNAWFNKDLVITMCESYLVSLKKYISTLPERCCKGVMYKHIGGRNIFCEDIYKKVVHSIELAIGEIHFTRTPKELYNAYKYFMRYYIKLTGKFISEFIDAYKGCGAFYTMQNLILFHGCRFEGKLMNQSYDYIKKKQKKYSDLNNSESGGWRMFAVMKELLKTNNIDIEEKLKRISKN